MKQTAFVVTAPASGSGKTLVTSVLLSLLKEKGLDPAAFKTGPDYIDPMYHRTVLGLPGHNLDLFLAEAETVKDIFGTYGQGHRAVVVEGGMGYYDGLTGGGTCCSTWEIGNLLDLPVLLVVDAKGAGFSIAAVIKGMVDFRPRSCIKGVFLNRIREKTFWSMAPVIEQETGLPVVGYLPPLPEAALPSRHLGLFTAEEIPDLAERVRVLTGVAEETVDLKKLLSVFSVDTVEKLFFSPFGKIMTEKQEAGNGKAAGGKAANGRTGGRPVIALARDRAFSFVYDEALDLLTALGADIRPFSPLNDAALPACDALFLPGGYPELYAAELSANGSMRESIRSALTSGLPCIAECGGHMYLQEALTGEDGKTYPMVGFFDGHVKWTKGLVRFGYADMTADGDSLLFRKGERISVHSFHHYDLREGDGEKFSLKKPFTGTSWREGESGSTYYSAFPHLYLPGCPAAAERFVSAAEAYRRKRKAGG